MAEKRKLTDHDCEILISEVQSRICLWNDRHNDFKNNKVTKKLWEEVGQAVNLPGGECKTKWKNLKDTFRKIVKTPPAKSGSAASLPHKTWKFATLMGFTRDVILPNPMPGNLVSPSIGEEEDTGPDPSPQQDTMSSCAPSVGFSRPHRSLRSIKKKVDREERMLELKEKKINAVLNKGIENNKGDDHHFFLSLLPYISRLDDLEKLQLRIKIQNCVFEAVRDHEPSKEQRQHSPGSVHASSSNASRALDLRYPESNSCEPTASNILTN